MSYVGFHFLQGSLNLVEFVRNWFLIDIKFCKPGVIKGLSLKINLFLEFILEGHRCQIKSQSFQGKFIRFSCVCVWRKQKNIPVNWEIIKYKSFLIKSWLVAFIIIGLRVRGIENDIRSYKKLWKWSDIEAANLPEIILGTVMLEKISSINVLELLVTLLGCSKWGRK